MAVKPTVEETPKQATLADMVSAAKKAEEVAAIRKEAAVDAEREARIAAQAAQDFWNALFNHLLALKEENKGSESFRNSKLGQLLNQAR